MSRRCDLTGKTAQTGHKVSHSNRKSKRRFLPNLCNVTFISDALDRSVKLRVSPNALKSVDHRGRPRCLPYEGEGRGAVARGARAQAGNRQEARLGLTGRPAATPELSRVGEPRPSHSSTGVSSKLTRRPG